ncbi:MAG: hypothetical protein JO117_00855 [Verrucomicrobia bacterium]|nr:hypothetical protein [Verrucomicrobiota bacterium]MBV9657411.1 hypothetical protein [Verrucomicrobiota bacterium]
MPINFQVNYQAVVPKEDLGAGESAEQRMYFATTCWTTVLAATQPTGDRSAALQELCKIYWQPVFVFLRRRGYSRQDAEDATQDFFLNLLANDVLGRADKGRGRFRSFLLTALRNFTADAHDRTRAEKRGGQYEFLSWETLRAASDTTVWTEPADQVTPEAAFERQWAHVLLRQTLSQLRREMASRGKEAIYIALLPFLTVKGEAGAQERAAQKLGLSLANWRVTLFRMRDHYRRCLRAEVARTLEAPGEVRDELRHLAAVLRREGSEG